MNEKLKSPTYPRDRQQEKEFFQNLHFEELEAIEMLQVATSSCNPDLQTKAISKLRRVSMDYFAAKYLHYAGHVGSRIAYHIDYSYHKDFQDGKDFSMLAEGKRIEEMPPIVISGVLMRD